MQAFGHAVVVVLLAAVFQALAVGLTAEVFSNGCSSPYVGA